LDLPAFLGKREAVMRTSEERRSHLSHLAYEMPTMSQEALTATAVHQALLRATLQPQRVV
jgi:hypothetical protein